MSRYIDADKLVEKYERVIEDEWNKKTSPSSWTEAYDCVISDIDDQPTADVDEVRHGEWIDKHCSLCGETQPHTARGNAFATTFYQVRTKFCPNCGAKMDGERREK